MSILKNEEHCHPHMHEDGEVRCHPHRKTERHRSAGVLPTIALVGNPNTGKTTLFNSLTGLRQHVGNYPGVTVSKFSGTLPLVHGKRAELVDLPGIYSLAATSLDERVVIDVLAGHMAKDGTPVPDAIVCVADVNNLQRNLFLVSQVSELGIPMVLVLNQIDVAERDGLHVNTELLKKRLGIPVIACSARKGIGIDAIRQAIVDVLDEPSGMKTIQWNAGTLAALATLREGLSPENRERISDAELQRIIFDVGSTLVNRLLGEDVEKTGELVKKARECIRSAGENPHSTEAIQRYAFIKELLDGVIERGPAKASFSSVLDKILLHRIFGFVIFIGIMYGVFYSLYTLSGIPMDWIDEQFSTLGDFVSEKLEAFPIVSSLIVDGAIAGVGGVLMFLPQVLILFFFLGLLESTGYMARAAFLMDKCLGWCGLNGKSFVPLLSGFACGVPGIMGARTIEDPKARLATILAVPFMSCGARMPVYVLMCGILERLTSPFVAATVFVCMYLVGIIVAVPVSFIYTRFFIKSKPAPFVLEMPRYQLPRVRDVALRVWQSGVAYTKRAGTIIFAVNVIVWALLFFPYSENDEFKDGKKEQIVSELAKEYNAPAETLQAQLDGEKPENPNEAKLALSEEQIEEINSQIDNQITEACLVNSYLGRFGKFCQPVFDPCGFDWRITIGILASFPAREGIVATLGTIFSLGDEEDEKSEGLKAAMQNLTWEENTPRAGQKVFTVPVILGLLVFFALCGQCLAEIVVIARETSWKWGIIAWVQMTGLAWIGAVLCFQIGNLF